VTRGERPVDPLLRRPLVNPAGVVDPSNVFRRRASEHAYVHLNTRACKSLQLADEAKRAVRGAWHDHPPRADVLSLPSTTS
jgi:hypothetical protein